MRKETKKNELKSFITNNCGTPIYMAPEVMEESSYTSKADIYSFGLIMYEVITDNRPFSHLKSFFQILNTVVSENKKT